MGFISNTNVLVSRGRRVGFVYLLKKYILILWNALSCIYQSAVSVQGPQATTVEVLDSQFVSNTGTGQVSIHFFSAVRHCGPLIILNASIHSRLVISQTLC